MTTGQHLSALCTELAFLVCSRLLYLLVTFLTLQYMKHPHSVLNESLLKAASTQRYETWACNQIQEGCPFCTVFWDLQTVKLKQRFWTSSRTFFGDHCKISDKSIKFLDNNFKMKSWLPEGPRVDCIEPCFAASYLALHQEDKSQKPGTYVLFNLMLATSLHCWSEESVRHHMNSVVPFFRNNQCPCLHCHLPHRSVDSK